MNRALLTILSGCSLFAGMLFFTGCDDKEEDHTQPPAFGVSEKEKTFTSDAGAYAVSVYSNLDWKATPEGDWFTIDKSEGSGNGVIRITAEANTTETAREGSVTLNSGTLSETVKLRQEAFSVILRVLGEDYYEVRPEGGNLSVEVEANVDYTFELSPWVTSIGGGWGYSAVKSFVTLDIAPNLSIYQREANLIIRNKKTEAVVKEIRLQQSALQFQLGMDTCVANSLGEEFDVPVLISAGWELRDPFEGLESERWFTAVKGEQGEQGEQKITVTADKNPSTNARSGIITFYLESGYEAKLVVKQEGRLQISVGENHHIELICDAGDSKFIPVIADGEWTAEDTTDWFSVIKTDGGFTVTHEKNKNLTADRLATFTLWMVDSSSSVEVNLVQAIYTDPLQLQEYSVLVDEKARDKTVRIEEARGELSVFTESDWFTPTVEDGYINIALRANEDEERTGSITVTLKQGETEVATKVITVVQQKKATEVASVVIDPKVVDIPKQSPEGTTFDVAVTANIEWAFKFSMPVANWTVEKVSPTLLRVTYIKAYTGSRPLKNEIYIYKPGDEFTFLATLKIGTI